MADFRTIVTDMMLQLSQTNLAANARMDRFETRMDRLEARIDRLEERMDEFREDLKVVLVTLEELLETNRRGFGFQTTND